MSSKTQALAVIAAAATALVLASGCADEGYDDDLCGPAVIAETNTLDRGLFVEGYLVLTAGSRLVVTYESSRSLLYDVHVHDGDDVETLISGDGTSERFEIVADKDADHFVMWINPSDASIDLDVEIDIDGSGCWRGWLK